MKLEMEQNNDVKQQNNFEYKEFVETMSFSQQSLAEFGSYVKHNHTISQNHLVSNQTHQEYATTSQNLNTQQTQFESKCVTIPVDIKIKPADSIKNMAQTRHILPKSIGPQQITSAPLKCQANSLAIGYSNGSILNPSNSQVITAAVPKILATQGIEGIDMKNIPKSNVTVSGNSKLINRSKSFRAVEFVLNNLESVPGEEKFYNRSSKAKDFANVQLSQEKFYAQTTNSNVASSSDPHSNQPIIDNEQQENQQTDMPREETSKRKSDDGSSPKNIKKKSKKNAKIAVERDRILIKYSKNLMRKKPKSWQPQERSNDEDLSSDI